MKDPLTNFLPRITVNNDFEPVYDIDVILQSIYTILVTHKGSRRTQPEFGCNLLLYLFSPFSDTTIDDIKKDITSALERWEPRIRVLSVNIELDDVSRSTTVKHINVTIDFEYNERLYKHTFKVYTDESMLEGTIYNVRSQ